MTQKAPRPTRERLLTANPYLHGTAPDEQDRLGLMNRLLNENSLRELRLPPGDRVLNVGCGLGQLSRDIARQVGPAGKVVAVERSSEQLDVAPRACGRSGRKPVRRFSRRPGRAVAARGQRVGQLRCGPRREFLPRARVGSRRRRTSNDPRHSTWRPHRARRRSARHAAPLARSARLSAPLAHVHAHV